MKTPVHLSCLSIKHVLTLLIMEERKERIVVVGGGFAGLNLVKKLDKNKYDVTLIDINNYHSFPPLFYQVASAGLEPSSISFPFRSEFRKNRYRNLIYNLGRVKSIDLTAKTILTEFETVEYDRLVIATGSANNFFNSPGLVEIVYTLKSTAEAIRCRNDILDRLEQAAICHDAAHRRRLLNFVVVGGGPAGVEVAGALGEMKRYILHRDYPSINKDEITITLIEGSNRLLGAMSEKSSAAALKFLKSLLVTPELGVVMTDYSDGRITLSDGRIIGAGMVIWTAGVKGADIPTAGGELPKGRGNRIIVDGLNRVKGFDCVYAIGDICIMPDVDSAFPQGHPQLAQPAIQQGRNLAANLNAPERKKLFKYKDKGSMATVGRNRAVVDLKHSTFTGFFAWITWMFIHLISLLGMRNKVVVLFNWLWAYFSYGTALRLLIHPSKYPLRKRWGEQ